MDSKLEENQPDGGIFISYRRDDTVYAATMIESTLVEQLIGMEVFKDLSSIKPGEPWKEKIDRALASCSVLLALIGNQWATDEKGQNRLAEPDDFVRYEIEIALERKILVVPVLFDGADLDKVELPDSMKSLKDRQSFVIHRDSPDRDIRALIESLPHSRPESDVLGPGYLDHVSSLHQKWETEYTNLNLTYNLRLETWEGRRYKEETDNRSVREAVDDYDRLVILGEPGSGKTTAVHRLAFDFAQERLREPIEDALIPVVIRLKLLKLFGKASTSINHISTLIGMSVESIGWQADTNVLLNTLSHKPVLLLFDGLNEVGFENVARCVSEIKEFIDTLPKGPKRKVIITSRKYNYADYCPEFQTMELLELSDEGIKDYLYRFLGDHAKADHAYSLLDLRIRRLVQNPLLLSFAAIIYKKNGTIPRSRGTLIQDFVRMRLNRESEQSSRPPVPSDIKQIALNSLGEHMQKVGLALSEEETLDIIKKALDGHRSVDSAELVEDLCAAEILVRVSTKERGIEFWHQAIQEYFAASYMASIWRDFAGGSRSLGSTKEKRRELKKRVEGYISQKMWHEALAMMAGLLPPEHVSQFITYVRKRNILLAGMCVSNVESISKEEEDEFLKLLERRLARACLMPRNASALFLLATSFVFIIAYLILHRGIILFRVGKHFQPFITIPIQAAAYLARIFGDHQISYGTEITLALITAVVLSAFVNWLVTRSFEKTDEWIEITAINRTILPTISALRYIGINSTRAQSKLSEIGNSVSGEAGQYLPDRIRNIITAFVQKPRIETYAELLEMLHDPEKRQYAIYVLGETASPEAMGPLTDLLLDNDDFVVAGSLLALTKMAERTRDLVPEIGSLLHKVCIDTNRPIHVRRTAYKCAANLRLGAMPPRPMLTIRDITRYLALTVALVKETSSTAWGTVLGIVIAILALVPGLALSVGEGFVVYLGLHHSALTLRIIIAWAIILFSLFVLAIWTSAKDSARPNWSFSALRIVLLPISLPIYLLYTFPKEFFAQPGNTPSPRQQRNDK